MYLPSRDGDLIRWRDSYSPYSLSVSMMIAMLSVILLSWVMLAGRKQGGNK
jgi:hypothetical protein